MAYFLKHAQLLEFNLFQIVEIIGQNIGTKKIKIIVKDCGSGMSNEKIKQALANYNPKNYNHSNTESIELCLPIVRFLIEKQNGTIEINSTKNYGTEVVVVF